MSDRPDFMRNVLPAQAVQLNPSYGQPWFSYDSAALASNATKTWEVTIQDPDYIYYVDQVTFYAVGFKQFQAELMIGPSPITYACGTGNYVYNVRNNPSIYFVDGDTLSIIMKNMEATGQTFGYSLVGTKFPRPANFGKPPVIYFTGTPLSGYKPLSVAFTPSCLYEPTAYEWDFGDGSTKDVTANPTHIYQTSGMKSPKLKGTNAYGYDTFKYRNYIRVNESPSEYTEVDPASIISVNATGFLATNCARTVPEYVYKDFGANHFDSIVAMGRTAFANGSGVGEMAVMWFSNAVGGMYSGSGIKYGVYYASNLLGMCTMNGTTVVGNMNVAAAQNTAYYLKLIKLAGSSTLTCYVYSDVNYSVLVNTLVLTDSLINTKMRYFYMLNNYDDGVNQWFTVDVDDYAISNE